MNAIKQFWCMFRKVNRNENNNDNDNDNGNKQTVSIQVSNFEKKNNKAKNSDLKYINIGYQSFFTMLWLFFIIFGNVQENKQLQNFKLLCESENSNTDSHVFPFYYNEHCNSSQDYNIAFHILSLFGSLIGFSQIYFYTRHVFYNKIAVRFFDIFFMFKSHIISSSFLCPYIASIYVYQYLQFNVFFCNTCSSFCNQKPKDYNIVHKIYLSTIVFLSIYLFTQICSIGLFLYLFFKHKILPWTEICKIESNLFVIKFF